MDKTLLSVIVLSHNTKKITIKCLSKLFASIKYAEKKLTRKIDVKVVDNASSDGSSEAIKANFPQVKLIKNNKNVGFAKANNQAMKTAKGEYFLLLNSDVYVCKHTLFDALSFLGNDESIDVLGVRLRYADGSFQPCGGYLPTPFRTTLWILGLDTLPLLKNFSGPIHQFNPMFYLRIRKLEWLSGAFFLLKKEVFEKTCGFDENIKMYTEDIEWCKRINDAGFKIVFNPKIGVIHLGGASGKGDEGKTIVRVLRGIKYYHQKHYPDSFAQLTKIIWLGINLRYCFFSLIGSEVKKNAYLRIKNKDLKNLLHLT